MAGLLGRRRGRADAVSADVFFSPAPVDLRTSLEVDSHLLAAAAEFEAVDLPPVAPLGVTSTVANTSQNRVLSALRMTEVVSDPTNVLALECARRLRTSPNTPIHLATSQRVVRAQPIPKLPGYSRHFRVFVLASGGRELKHHAFTVDTISRISWPCCARSTAGAARVCFGERRVDILATSEREPCRSDVAACSPSTRCGSLSTMRTIRLDSAIKSA